MFRLRLFFRDDRGAITAEWLVLSAGVALVAMLALGAIQQATQNAAHKLAITPPQFTLTRTNG